MLVLTFASIVLGILFTSAMIAVIIHEGLLSIGKCPTWLKEIFEKVYSL